ncbi:MAG: ATPase [Lachnospiraceae bacterium]|nr:ATPase [Lachnospiraceae bacterium]
MSQEQIKPTDNIEITIEEMADLPEGTYTLIDIRDDISYSYGTMPEAVSCPDIFKNAVDGALPKDKKLVLLCMHGTQSADAAYELRNIGYEAYSLKDGYGAWLRKSLSNTDRSSEIESSIMKNRRFRESLFSRFTKAIKTYELVEEGDRIAVCISGGKDSMLMAKLFQELKRHKKFSFELVFLVMDPGYNELNRLIIESNAASLGIPITVFETTIFDAVYDIEKSPCYLCARMRRGHLYSKAKELGCNKIALGHHYDDVIETILMGMLWGAQVQTMMPKLHSTNFEGMELIRPMYLIREDDIKAWRDYNNLHFIQCACHFTDTCSSCRDDGVSVSKRMETKKLIAKLKETNPFVETNIFNSVKNVSLDTLIAYKKDGIVHNFLDDY